MKQALLLGGLACATVAAFAAPRPAAPPAGSGTVAVRAGTIHLVEDGVVLEGGATLLVRDGRVLAVGQDVEVPPDARVVDYGADAVIVPGLVAASSSLGVGPASPRTADPAVRAIDNFDPYSRGYLPDLAGGVTSVYLEPARGRLIAGQGAVVKLSGADPEGRVLSASAAIHGSIAEDARGVPGYWEPPIPATVDAGLGRAEPQLPGSLMGAMVALRELLSFARGQADHADLYGRATGAELAELLREGVPWRLRADSEAEVRALLGLAQEARLPLVIDGARHCGDLAAEIARASARVVLEVDVAPGRPGRDLGTARDARWPEYDNAVRLAEAGVTFAIATPDSLRPRDLRFAAALASRGGLDGAAALRAITLGAAEILGVAERVGSLAAGKDADFVVLNGAPLDVASSVLATWVEGEPAWKAPGAEGAVVVQADELFVGDGTVLAPGELLIRDGRIAQVGRRVARPQGAVVVRGPVAMPGMIDAAGHLGLEGSSKTPATDFKLTRIVAPGDHVARRVARAGVTTVVLSPRGDTKSGTPLMAYKPAGSEVERMVVADPAALRLLWTERDRVESGKNVKELLAKAVEYDQKWRDYEKALAEWQARPQPAADAASEEKKKDDEGADEKAEEGKDEDESKSKKGKLDKDDEQAEEVHPVAGIWEADVVLPPRTDAAHLRLRLEPHEVEVEGSLRCDAVSETLVELSGTFAEGEVHVRGLGSRGWVSLVGKPKKDKLKATLTLGEASVELEAERTSTELPRAARSERRKQKGADEKEPKDKPKAPGVDEKLEPLRRALHGEGAVVVQVDWREEIRDCVQAFERVGIKPVLYGADDAWRMTDELRGRVAGVLLSQQVLDGDPRGGLESLRNRFAELEAAGIPVAFASNAEEGAAELALLASYAVSLGMSADGALRALCADAARMFSIDERVGRLAPGLDGDVLLLDGPPLDPRTSVLRAWVAGEEVR